MVMSSQMYSVSLFVKHSDIIVWSVIKLELCVQEQLCQESFQWLERVIVRDILVANCLFCLFSLHTSICIMFIHELTVLLAGHRLSVFS